MSKNKGIILGIVLIIVAIVIGAFEGYQLYTADNTKNKKEEFSISEDTSKQEDGSYEDVDYEEEIDETEETDETEDTVDFRIEGLNEETYELLDTTEEDLAKLLYEWTQNRQDYGTAVGVSFYPECEINIIDQKYTLSMKTIVGEGFYPEASRTIILDYYKTSGQYDIH